MLAKFGTPLKVFSATTSELAKVEGLGEARAKKIKNMLTTKNKLQKESTPKDTDITITAILFHEFL